MWKGRLKGVEAVVDLGEAGIDEQGRAILHQAVTGEAELYFRARPLAI